MKRAILITTLAAFVFVACDSQEDDFSRRNTPKDENAPPSDPTQPGTCKEGVPHKGFGDTDFALNERKPGGIGNDRRRLKPFSALQNEFQRTLGKVPANLKTNAAAYGTDPPRWYSEPAAGAVSLSTLYNLAFSTCYDTMTDPKYGAAPLPDTAKDECARMQRKSWQRSPTPEETQACVDLATTQLGAEPVPRRRWAHACAAIITSTGFTTY